MNEMNKMNEMHKKPCLGASYAWAGLFFCHYLFSLTGGVFVHINIHKKGTKSCPHLTLIKPGEFCCKINNPAPILKWNGRVILFFMLVNASER